MSQLAEMPANLRQHARCPACGAATRVLPTRPSRQQLDRIAAETAFLNPWRRVLECENCRSQDLVRCRRTRLERWILDALGMWAFTCRNCQSRYYGPKWARRSPDAGEEQEAR